MSSILDDVKHALGLLSGNNAFDSDIVMHINTVFSTLKQLGVGPDVGFAITDNTAQWVDFNAYSGLNAVKSYMYLRVKLLFDPPQVGFVISSMDRQILEHEWRCMIEADEIRHPIPPQDGPVVDGGGPDDSSGDIFDGGGP